MKTTLTMENLIVACVFVSFIVAVVTGMITMKVMERKQRKSDERRDKNAAEKEKRRIAGLPPLDIRHLLMLPKKIADQVYGQDRKGFEGTFGTHYNRVAIIDRNGNAWVGLLTSDVIVSLRDSEYVHASLWVPFRGLGEADRGAKVVLEEVEMDIYPLSLSSDDTGTTDWQQWLRIEKWWNDSYPCKIGYAATLEWIYPRDRRFASRGGVR